MITQKIIARTDSLKLDKIISRYGEDSMRQVVFVIVRTEPDSEDLIPITIPEDAVGSFRILKPSGNFVIVPMSKSVLATGETAFDVVLPASANTAKGSGYYDIRITSDTDKYYFTAQGDFLIDDNIISDEVLEDVSEVNGLIFPDDFLTVKDHVAYIDDDTISTDSTWSSNKINEEIEAHAGGDVSKTVSGNPITFTDGAAAPLVKCVTQITGYQQGSGTPSPDNIRPIVAYTEGEIEVSEENLFDYSTCTNVAIDNSGNEEELIIRLAGDYDEVTPNTTYNIIDIPANITVIGYANYSSNKTFIGRNVIDSKTNTTITPQGSFIRLLFRKTDQSGLSGENVKTVKLLKNLPTTHTTTYPSAIYRGSEDVVGGEVSCQKFVVTYNGTENWVQNSTFANTYYVNFPSGVIKSFDSIFTNQYIARGSGDIGFMVGSYLNITDPINATSIADWKAYLSTHPLEVCYELATPTTSSVTPTNLPIKSLSGYNHIESSTGDMEVEYITQRFQPIIDSIKQL